MEASCVLRDLLTKTWVTVDGLNLKIYHNVQSESEAV